MARTRKVAEPFLNRVEALLREAFPPPDHVSVEDDDGIVGIVASARFRGLESMDRQAIIWDALDAKLPEEQRKRILIVVAVTPEEQRAMQQADHSLWSRSKKRPT